MDLKSKIEEATKRLKTIEQEYVVQIGRIKQLEELLKEESEGKDKKEGK
jgi:phage shock protein A